MHERKLLAVFVPWAVRPSAQLVGGPPCDWAIHLVVQRSNRGLDGLQITRDTAVHRFHRRALVGDRGVDRPALGPLERGEGSTDGDLSRHVATVTAAVETAGRPRCQFAQSSTGW